MELKMELISIIIIVKMTPGGFLFRCIFVFKSWKLTKQLLGDEINETEKSKAGPPINQVHVQLWFEHKKLTRQVNASELPGYVHK